MTLLINWLILRPRKFEIVGEGKDWLLFWGSFISSIASFAMVMVTWWTLKQNIDYSRPQIYIELVKDKLGKLYLRCKNVGNSTAKIVSVHFDEKFVNGITLDIIKKQFQLINDTTFVLPRDMSKELLLCYSELDSCYLRIYGGNVENKTIEFAGKMVTMDDLNKCFDYIDNNCSFVIIRYDNYVKKETFNISSYINKEQDKLLLIAVGLDRIVTQMEIQTRILQDNKH